VVDDLADAAIGCDDRREKDHQAVHPIHIGVRPSQLLHHVAQIHPQVAVLGQFLGGLFSPYCCLDFKNFRLCLDYLNYLIFTCRASERARLAVPKALQLIYLREFKKYIYKYTDEK